MRVYTHDRHVFPLPPRHRFPLAKYRLVRARVEELRGVAIHEAEPLGWDDLARAHHHDWIAAVRDGTLSRREEAGLGLPWSHELARRTLVATAATVAAARAALADGASAALGGGTHHGRYRRGRGFCVVNDVAVAIALLRRDGFRGRVLILDLDVHQGDGNADIFANDASVVVVGVQAARNYPFDRDRLPGDVDVDLPDGAGDPAYLAALDAALAAAATRGPYDLAFLLAGADPWEHDALGRLAVTAAGLEERDRRATRAIRAAGTPLVLTLAGGYGRPLEGTAAIHATSVGLAAAAG